jgi:hypothetical protein
MEAFLYIILAFYLSFTANVMKKINTDYVQYKCESALVLYSPSYADLDEVQEEPDFLSYMLYETDDSTTAILETKECLDLIAHNIPLSESLPYDSDAAIEIMLMNRGEPKPEFFREFYKDVFGWQEDS